MQNCDCIYIIYLNINNIYATSKNTNGGVLGNCGSAKAFSGSLKNGELLGDYVVGVRWFDLRNS